MKHPYKISHSYDTFDICQETVLEYDPEPFKRGDIVIVYLKKGRPKKCRQK